MDHYAVLGVSSDSSADEIAQQYRMLKRLYQTDDGESDRATQRMREIDAAYQALSSMDRKPTKPVTVLPQHVADDHLPAGARVVLSDGKAPSVVDYMPPVRSTSGMSQRLPVYALIFVLLIGGLVLAIRRGSQVPARTYSADTVAPPSR